MHILWSMGWLLDVRHLAMLPGFGFHTLLASENFVVYSIQPNPDGMGQCVSK